MAFKKKESEYAVNYKAELNELKKYGPQRLYCLWGNEEYLRERFVDEVSNACIPDGDDGFSLKKLNGAECDYTDIREAIDAVPFLSERTYVEIRDFDFTKPGDNEAKKLIDILSDIPEYCTVCIVAPTDFEPDSRKKIFKSLSSISKLLKFTSQDQGALIEWISRRFASYGKSIDIESAQRLMFISGDTMNRLLPEIEKIAAYCKDEKIRIEDIDKIANHIPEADVFEMISALTDRRYNTSAKILAELLSNKSNEPIAIIALLNSQLRKSYYASKAQSCGKSSADISAGLKIKEFAAKQLYRSVQGTSPLFFADAIRITAQAELEMKSSGADNALILKEAFGKIVYSGKKYEIQNKGNYYR